MQACHIHVPVVGVYKLVNVSIIHVLSKISSFCSLYAQLCAVQTTTSCAVFITSQRIFLQAPLVMDSCTSNSLTVFCGKGEGFSGAFIVTLLGIQVLDSTGEFACIALLYCPLLSHITVT